MGPLRDKDPADLSPYAARHRNKPQEREVSSSSFPLPARVSACFLAAGYPAMLYLSVLAAATRYGVMSGSDLMRRAVGAKAGSSSSQTTIAFPDG